LQCQPECPNVSFRGSKSEELLGELRVNERDAGWFWPGFYLTSDVTYASGWGENVFKMFVPNGKFAHVDVIGNYDQIEFDGDAEKANQAAGGTAGWIEDEAAWSRMFGRAMQEMGFDGVRVHFGQLRDGEVVMFDLSTITVVGRLPRNPQPQDVMAAPEQNTK
jgi:hypothetical protein